MTMQDVSGIITAGGTAQTLFSGVAKGFWIENIDASEALFVNDSVAASTTDGKSVSIPAGAIYETPSWWGSPVAVATVSVVAATTGHKFSARRY
jgi:hypothetical protein